MDFKCKRLFQVYLIDQSFDDRVKCFMENWTVEAYRIPRRLMKSSAKEFPELENAGIYFLIGDLEGSRQGVYVGQASKRSDGSGLATRISEHDKDDEYWWSDAIVLTTTNDSWGPTELCFLEHGFYVKVKDSIGCEIKNKQEPADGKPREERKTGMEEAMQMGMCFLSILGCDVLEYEGVGRNEVSPELKDAKQLFGKSKNCDAKALLLNDGRFLLLKGSVIEPDLEPSVKNIPRVEEQRKTYALSIDSDNVVTENIPFKSASAASMFASGTTQPGTQFWKTEDGVTLRELDNR